MCQSEPWGANAASTEVHPTRKGQPPRMHGQKGQREPPVPLSGGNCDLWCPWQDSKDLAGRSEQGQADTSRSGYTDAEYDPLLEGYTQWSTSSM